MKPCSRNRKHIAWLALDALDVRQAKELRAHLETCAGCRGYLEEISNATQRLTAAETMPDIRASESFHQRVVARLSAKDSESAWATAVAHLRGSILDWRVALPMVGATVVMIALLLPFLRRPKVALPATSQARIALSPNLNRDLPPTIANYQMVANQSLEKLDELLTRQGNRNLPPAPIYTASTFNRVNTPD